MKRPPARAAAPLLLAATVVACAGTPRVVVPPIRLTARSAPSGKTAVTVQTAKQVFDEAGAHLAAKRWKKAIAGYDHVLRDFPRSRFELASLYNGGLAYEKLDRWLDAAARYRKVFTRHFTARDGVDAGFRLAACLAEGNRYSASARALEKLLTHDKLMSEERIEALARLGFARYSLSQHRKARRILKKALAFHASLKERLDGDYYLGMARYYLAAIAHARFRKQRIAAGKAMGAQMNAKAMLLAATQRRYVQTISLRNAYWASAAGFQIGSLYREMYNSLMGALPTFNKLARDHAPREKLSIEKTRKAMARVYLEELHKRIKPLLHKSIRVFERTLSMAERVGLRASWVDKSRYQLKKLRDILAATPDKAIQMLPRKRVPPDQQPGLPLEQPKPLPSKRRVM